MTTEQRAFPPFRVPGGVAIARRRHFPKYLVKGAGLPEWDSDSDSDSETDSDDVEEGPIGCVIVVRLPDVLPYDQGGEMSYYVFTVFGNNFRADSAEFKDLFFNSKPGKELYQLYTTTLKEELKEEFKEPPQFMEENIEIAKFLYVKALGKITMVHEYTIGGYYS